MEKAKPSKLKNWLLRILIASVVLIAIGLLMLKSLGGTSESHRRGLEQAFSDFLKAEVHIGQLHTFNLLPQLRFDASDLSANNKVSMNAYTIRDIKLAFGLWDLLLNRGRIEDMDVIGFKFETGPPLEIAHLGIVRGAVPIMQADGIFEDRSFTLAVQMQSETRGRPSYFFGPRNTVRGAFGTLDFSGIFAVKAKNREPLRDIEVKHQARAILTGSGGFDESNDFKIKLHCSGSSIAAEAQADLKFLIDAGWVEVDGACMS